MTAEKRFKLSKWCGMASHSCILDGDSGLMLQGEVVGLLNTLHQENQELKEVNEKLNEKLSRMTYHWNKVIGEVECLSYLQGESDDSQE